MGRLGDVLGPLGGVLGASWGRLGDVLGGFGRSWRDLGAKTQVSGPLGGVLGRIWGVFGASLGRLGDVLGTFWGVLGGSWGDLGAKTQQKQKPLKNHWFLLHFCSRMAPPTGPKTARIITALCHLPLHPLYLSSNELTATSIGLKPLSVT